MEGDLHGTSAFLRDGDRVFHTYSTYGRGTEQVGGTHYYLDLTALGRQEDWEEPAGRSGGGAPSAFAPGPRKSEEDNADARRVPGDPPREPKPPPAGQVAGVRCGAAGQPITRWHSGRPR
jgi:hypothetical protein